MDSYLAVKQQLSSTSSLPARPVSSWFLVLTGLDLFTVRETLNFLQLNIGEEKDNSKYQNTPNGLTFPVVTPPDTPDNSSGQVRNASKLQLKCHR